MFVSASLARRRPLLIATLALLAAAAAAPAPAASPKIQGAPQAGQPYVQEEPRGMARVVFFNDSGVAGEYTVEYGKPAWQAAYDEGFDKLTKGKRLRLGKDYWTTLDTWCPLTIGEKEVKAGAYFLALECSDKGQWSLVLLDPEPLRKVRFDAYETSNTKGGALLPLEHSEVKENEAALAIRFVADAKDPKLQTLEIRFGRHRLAAKVKPKV